MVKKTRYEVNDLLFDEQHNLLANRLNITEPFHLKEAETKALEIAYRLAADHYTETHSFTDKDICDLHQLFLKDIFSWAGQYREVDISSQDIRYCHAVYIAREMATYARIYLKKLTPFTVGMSTDEIADKLATIHGELIIIHPFRDGNGRTTRLLCDLLLMQAGRKTLDQEKFYQNRDNYFRSIQQLWHTGNNDALAQIIQPHL